MERKRTERGPKNIKSELVDDETQNDRSDKEKNRQLAIHLLRTHTGKLSGWGSKKGLVQVADISEHYQWLKKLGEGAYGTVWEAVNVKEQENNLKKYAVKIIEKSSIETNL